MEVFVGPHAVHASPQPGKVGARFDVLERAIYSTIAYRDVFDFAPTLDEIHRFLHGIRCDRSEVEAALAHGGPLASHLVTDGTYFALKNRGDLIALGLERRALTEQFWPAALNYTRFLSNLPHVRMVAVTGSFAAQNVKPDCDIDFMILTEAGTMWRTRALAITASLWDRTFGSGKLCPNYLLSVAALALERRTLYDAHELCQMIPLYGRATYDDLRRANLWTSSFLPNADGPPSEEHCFDRAPLPALRRFIEWGSHSIIGRAIENFEAKRKIHRFNETRRYKGVWTKATRETQGLQDSVRQDIENAWQRRLDALGAEEQ